MIVRTLRKNGHFLGITGYQLTRVLRTPIERIDMGLQAMKKQIDSSTNRLVDEFIDASMGDTASIMDAEHMCILRAAVKNAIAGRSALSERERERVAILDRPSQACGSFAEAWEALEWGWQAWQADTSVVMSAGAVWTELGEEGRINCFVVFIRHGADAFAESVLSEWKRETEKMREEILRHVRSLKSDRALFDLVRLTRRNSN